MRHLLFFLAWLAFCTTLPLFAAETEEHVATFLGLPRWMWLSTNLMLFLGILGYYVGPPLRNFLDARAQGIRDTLKRAQEQRQEAQEMKLSLESQIASLREEMDEALARAKGEGEKERQEILAQAESERRRLLLQTEEEVRLRIAQAQQQLAEYTAGLAAELARKKLEAAISADDLDRLFDENLGRLEREL